MRLCARLHRYAKRHGLATRTGLREALRAGLGVRFYPLLQDFCARLHRYAKRRGLATRTGLREALRAGLGVRFFRRLGVTVPIGQTGPSGPPLHQDRRCQGGRDRPKCRGRLRHREEGKAP